MNGIYTYELSKTIRKRKILNNINIKLQKEEIVGIIGPNGSGKSTLFKLLSNIYNPSHGKIIVDEIDLHENYEKISKKIGFLIEEPSLYMNLSCKDNLKYISKLYKQYDKEYFSSVCDILDICSYLDVKFKKCSLGMKQRLGIASAIIHNPDYILLDEPTNSLDAESVIKVKNLIKLLKKRGKGILVSSHVLNDMEEICDRIYILKNGEIIEEINNRNHKNNKKYLIKVQKLKIDLKEVQVYKDDNFDILQLDCNNLNDTLKFLCNNHIKIIDIIEQKNELERLFIERIGYIEYDNFRNK